MGGARINETEIATATKLAGRKSGVTHMQLATAEEITVLRAASILGRARAKRGGLLVERTPDGKRARTLTYFTGDSHRSWFMSHKPEKKKIATVRARARKGVKGKKKAKK